MNDISLTIGPVELAAVSEFHNPWLAIRFPTGNFVIEAVGQSLFSSLIQVLVTY